MVRNPIVAGKFYTGNPNILEQEVRAFIKPRSDKYNAFGCISPHAGYVYSGKIAGEVISSFTPRDTYIILGPNHTGRGVPFGLDNKRQWSTPLGEIAIDNELAEAILATSNLIEPDEECHNYEHSIEVQLPFLQVINKVFKFIPIVIAEAGGEQYKKIGKDIAAAITKTKRHVTIIASSDMTHYESHESAKKKDKFAIDKILALDVDGFLGEISKHSISMCGYAPAAIMLSACRELGAKHATLLDYQTSGDVSGDYSAVVGYAGIVIY